MVIFNRDSAIDAEYVILLVLPRKTTSDIKINNERKNCKFYKKLHEDINEWVYRYLVNYSVIEQYLLLNPNINRKYDVLDSKLK